MVNARTMRWLPHVLVVVAITESCTGHLRSSSHPGTAQDASTPAPRGSAAAGAGALGARAAGFRAAFNAMQAGRTAEARSGFEESISSLPELADHSLYHAGQLALRMGDPAGASRDFDRLLDEHAASVWFAAAAVERGRIALAGGDAAQAADLFHRAFDAGDPRFTPDARLGLAEALAIQGDAAQAYQIVDELRGSGGDLGAEARRLGDQLEERGATELGLTPSELALRSARARLRERRFSEAESALAPLLESSGPERGDALLTLARIRRAEGDGDAARRFYAETIAANPAPETAANALLERAQIAWNRDDDAAAEVDFAALVERFPGQAKAPEALYALGRIAEASQRYGDAARLYAELPERYPQDRLATDCAWRAAFARYLDGQYAAAEQAFSALGARDDAVYWRARSLERAGNGEQAREVLAELRSRSPRSYYAWWVDAQPDTGEGAQAAAPHSGELHGEPPPVTEGDAASPLAVEQLPGGAPALTASASYHWTRAAILAAIALDDDSAREFAAVEATSGPGDFLLPAYAEVHAYPQLVRLARRLTDSGMSGIEQYLYPRAYWTEFAHAGAQTDLDPLLLLALARQESLFDREARSSAGARGLMQLMPATAAGVAGQPLDEAAFSNPDLNAGLGARHLQSLLGRYSGRLIPSVAAYNAGADAVGKWEGRFGGVPGDEFVERISFRETRAYVKTVLANYRAYLTIYGPSPAAPPRLY